ncbi:MAG: hypothetical protein J6N49_07125 [Alphaproteobacteria bacterium]|nr:hypothetical protein [Alphaproteobacteria bacterium]
MELTITLRGKIYCSYCTRELAPNEECGCSASQRAIAKAKEKALHASLPDHTHDRPPRKRK